MAKTEFIRARIEPRLKVKVERILKRNGVSTTQVLGMLYRRIESSGEIPTGLLAPNAETARAIKEARAGRGVVKCKDSKDLFEKLEK